MVLRARQGRRDAATEWFDGRIFEIWTDESDGKLSVTSPPKGGPPRGPLIRFVLAVAQHVTVQASAHTIRAAVRRRPSANYRKNVAECVRLARLSRSIEQRNILFEMARTWKELADNAARLEKIETKKEKDDAA